MNMEIGINAATLFIMIASVWVTVSYALNAQSFDRRKPGKSNSGSTLVYNQHQQDLSVNDDHGDILLGDTDRHTDDIARDLEIIRIVDATFDARRFLDSGCLVYETVVMAFSNGDRELLHDLVSDDVYSTFSEVIMKREERCERVELHFVCLKNAEITDVALYNKYAQIKIGFIAQLVTTTRADNGTIVAGDPGKILDVSDMWTFARELTSKNATWKVVRTDSA